jgi:hypothetical protein
LGLRTDLDIFGKKKFLLPLGIDPRIFFPVGQSYGTIPAPNFVIQGIYFIFAAGTFWFAKY